MTKNKKMIAIDLDGTLLRSDSTLSAYTIDTLKKISSQGHQIIISTGRPFRMALPFYKELGLTGPMITFNGALTHIPGQKWNFEHSVRIDRDILLDVLKVQDDFEMDFVASEYKDKVFLSYQDRSTINPALFGLEAITDAMTLEISKITSDPNALLMQTRNRDKYQIADTLKSYLNNQVEVDSWGGPLNILEMAPKGVHKAYALDYLLRTLNRDPQDLIAFGDEHNDTEMLAYAGTGYAMKNANPLLLPFAKEQTNWTNDEDGVARTLEALFL
ncbi:Cof-type HAD-IIB family hydrolase [Streptococcus caprae]|uniref:Cof-type HAD-IIB family hydrolase n=1 Tax=Streptococcus caprae TaxID=1640501 RepID=A0ABV8CX70_9STRE